MEIAELTNEQRRQLIDAQQAFASWRPTAIELAKLGSLRAQSSKGKRYMYEVHGRVRKSLGRVSPALIRKKADLDARRTALKDTAQRLEKRLKQMAPVNRALGLGRIPTIAARILRELDQEGLLGTHVIVAGTNALYAYEVASGTVLSSDSVATADA